MGPLSFLDPQVQAEPGGFVPYQRNMSRKWSPGNPFTVPCYKSETFAVGGAKMNRERVVVLGRFGLCVLASSSSSALSAQPSKSIESSPAQTRPSFRPQNRRQGREKK